MDIATFDKFLDRVWALPIKDERMSVEEFEDPRSVQVMIRHASLPRTFHYVIVFPSPTDGMVVRKWWTHDKDVGIETPLQGVASPDMVLAQIEKMLAT